jgi:hypothetical protein
MRHDSAGLLLADRAQQLHLMAATSERTHDVELFQPQATKARAWTVTRPENTSASPTSRSGIATDRSWPRPADHAHSGPMPWDYRANGVSGGCY